MKQKTKRNEMINMNINSIHRNVYRIPVLPSILPTLHSEAREPYMYRG